MKKTERRFGTFDIICAGMAAAFMAVCSQIAVPMTVPFTMQTFALFCTLSALGGRNGFMAILTYILIGAAGAPVFSGLKGGIAALAGPTGGYIAGFLLSALVYMGIEAAAEKKFGIKLKTAALFAVMIVYYAFGTVWFMAVYSGRGESMGVMPVLSICVFPFVIPDTLKLLLALTVTSRIRVTAAER